MHSLSVLTIAVFVSACGSSSTSRTPRTDLTLTATGVVTVSGLPAGTPINVAHIHQAAGVNDERQRLPRVDVLIVEADSVPFDPIGGYDGQVDEQGRC